MKPFILGTRGSDLALVQTRAVARLLKAAHPDLELEERIIKTTGDERLDVRLSAPGSIDKGLFTKELEEALLRGEIHAAVHSLKDLPTTQPQGLVVGAVLKRANSGDCLASKLPGGWQGLPEGAVVATSSLRRKNQLRLLRPDLKVVEIRGNIPTRLRKVIESQDTDALVLARAALDRLGENVVPVGLDVTDIGDMLPAPGQGAVAVECCLSDTNTLQILSLIHHEETAHCVNAERELLASLGGGCHLPLGARAEMIDGQIHLTAGLFEENGVRWLSK